MYRTPTGPSGLVITSLNDDRGRLDAYWPRLRELDVLTPETAIISFEETDPSEWNTERIRRIMMQRGWEQAFVRTMQKAAPGDLEKGSLIHETTDREIDQTLESLFAQIERSAWEHSGKIALRERLDLTFCLNPNHWMCHPEVRFFIEGGELLFAVSEQIGPERICTQRYQYLTGVLEEATIPVRDAKRVAEAFDDIP